MRTRRFIVLIMACGAVGAGCERKSVVQPETEDQADSSGRPEASDSSPAVSDESPGGRGAATGEPAPDPRDDAPPPTAPQADSGAAAGGDTTPGAGELDAEPPAVDDSADSAGSGESGESADSADSAEPKVVMHNRTHPGGELWMTMPAYETEDGRLIRHGVVSEYSESGMLRTETHYTHGQKNGPYRTWYESGAMAQQGEFAINRQIGTWTWWYNNGRKEREGTFNEQNARDGVWNYWDREGNLLRQEIWVDGQLQPPSDS